jgi:hypothetical protein
MTALIFGLTAASARAPRPEARQADIAPLHELRKAKRVVADVFLEGHARLRPATRADTLAGRRILAAGIVDTVKRVQNDALQQ